MKLLLIAQVKVAASWQERFEDLKRFWEKENRFPSYSPRKSEEERFLNRFFSNARSPGNKLYQPTVREWYLERVNLRTWKERFEDLKRFWEDFGEVPTYTLEDEEENSLRIFLHNYGSPGNKKYFKPEIREWWLLRRKENISEEEKFNNLKEFYLKTKTLPSYHPSKSEEERSLNRWLSNSRSPGNRAFIPEVREWYLKVKQEILDNTPKKLPKPYRKPSRRKIKPSNEIIEYKNDNHRV